jgi:type IV pilus assembly protein PilC
MPEYIARVGTSDGTILERSFTAASEEALRADLAQREYLVLALRRKSGLGALLPDFRGRRSIRMKEFLLFNQELVALLKAGLPILAGLDILLERRKNPVFRKALAEIRDQVRGGASLSEAFDAQGDLFPKIYSSTLASGERSGEVPNVLGRYIAYQKTMLTLRRRVGSALIYPAFLLLLSFGVIFILITFVIPKFTEFYADFGADLPLITRVLVGFSGLVSANLVWLLAAAVGALLGFASWRRTPAGRRGVDRLKLRIPVIGSIFHRFAASRFLRTLSTLVAGGIPAVTAIGIAARAVGNSEFEARLLEVERKVREGGSLWQSIEGTVLFNDIAVEMTRVGESTGSLETMLANSADFYDEEIETQLSTVIALLEPLMLIGMGIVVGGMLLAIYLPLLQSYAQSSY